ncbi:MAG: hypothetical protein C0621_09545 [Desulfuromonas sp.]|nr:MAG: hypothetical protein C0621_09545 [Desulfuromonas sp.]
MQRLNDLLHRAGILPGLVDATISPLYLVGGAVRDTLVQRPIHDLDLVTPDDPTPLARTLARHMGAKWFMLDQKRRQSRVLLPGQEGLTVDFAPFRASTLEADLRARDFTLNACALDLRRPLAFETLIDPLGGREDLARGILRACSPTVLKDDPLRLLRGVRYLLEFELTLDPASEGWLRQASPALSGIAGERRCS